MKRIDVTGDIHVEALGSDGAQDPLVYIVFEDYPERQAVPIFAHEIKALVAALTEAAVWLADQVGGGHDHA